MPNSQVTETPLRVLGQGAFTIPSSLIGLWSGVHRQSGMMDAPEEGGEPLKNEFKTSLNV